VEVLCGTLTLTVKVLKGFRGLFSLGTFTSGRLCFRAAMFDLRCSEEVLEKLLSLLAEHYAGHRKSFSLCERWWPVDG
jgi:hypothetical protein